MFFLKTWITQVLKMTPTWLMDLFLMICLRAASPEHFLWRIRVNKYKEARSLGERMKSKWTLSYFWTRLIFTPVCGFNTQLAPPMETKVKNCRWQTGCFCKNWTRSNIIKEWVSILVKNSGLCAVNKRSYSNKLQHGATKGLLEMENVIYYQGCFWVLPQPITKEKL